MSDINIRDSEAVLKEVTRLLALSSDNLEDISDTPTPEALANVVRGIAAVAQAIQALTVATLHQGAGE